eukprot:scaffold1893_cov220-Amphora_coffeaeformis.AAC.3
MEGTPAAKGDVEYGGAVAETETKPSEDANDTLSFTVEPAARIVSVEGGDEEKKNEISDNGDDHANQKEHESATAAESEDTESKEEDPVKGNDADIESLTEDSLQKQATVSSPVETASPDFPSDQEAAGQELNVNKEKEPDTLDEKMAAYFDLDENAELDSTGDNKDGQHAASSDQGAIEDSSSLGVHATPPLPTSSTNEEIDAPPTSTSSPELIDALDATTKAPPPEVEGPTIERKSSSDAEDDDVASKAAIALAAVAAAATANHKSPAEAAAQARMVAQTLLSTNESNTTPEGNAEKPRRFQSVRLTLVKTHLRQRALEAGSQLMDKLAMGQNDAFLQHLLLLEYLRAVGDDETPISDDAVDDPAVANLACDRVWSLLKKIEGAYESLLQLLPDGRNKKDEGDVPVDYESPVVVPDLLPPCTSQKGDATVGFFRACTAYDENKDTKSDSSDQSPAQKASQRRTSESNSVATASTSAETQTDAASNASSRSMFSSMFRRQTSQQSVSKAPTSSMTATGILNTFRKKKKGDETSSTTTAPEQTNKSESNWSNNDLSTKPGEYVVQIEREMLGLTVENVLERTVVRTVLAGGPAKKAGARVGSLIVKVGNVETKNLTHFETIDELRQSQRPLVLVLKQISEDALRSAREEMGRLIRGSGFGNLYDGNKAEAEDSVDGANGVAAVRPLIGADLRINAFTHLLRRRLAEAGPEPKNKKEEALAKIAEKMIWLQTLFVIGLELESSRLFALIPKNDPSVSPRRDPHSQYHHTARDFEDAAKSVGKVLFDFTRKKLDPEKVQSVSKPPQPEIVGGSRRRKGGPPPPPPVPGRGRGPRRQPRGAGGGSQGVPHEKPILQIGDVLQRTRTFLADTTSPPAALLRGELISFLCDILDFDSDMELSEEDALTATAGAQAGPINDLGSAGSLLKLIVLNCPIMRSPGCEEVYASDESIDPTVIEELRRRFGPKEKFSAVDLHRLHAGNRFLAVVHRLAASRSTSARITACSLGPVIWGHLDFPHQLQLRGVITRALHDVEVTVRKATATVLHEIAELVFDPRCVPWLVLMCERAMTDPEPQLRSAAMTLTWHLAEHLPNAFLGNASQGSRYLRRLPDRSDPIFADVYLLQCKLLPVATRLAEDRSPSVRLAVAAQCDRLCDALGDHWSSVVIDVLLGLLSDTDERVRCEAVLCVPRLADIVLLSTPPGEVAVSEVSILEALVPASIRLQKDTVPTVRVSLAAAAGELLTILVALQSRAQETHESSFSERSSNEHPEAGKQYKRQVDERLIPLVQVLLNDPDPEVTSAALRAVTNASRRSMMSPRHRIQSMASEDDSASVASYHSHASRDARHPVFMPVLSEMQVLRLLPTLSELADSKQWRVRQSAVEIVPALLGCTHKQETRLQISKLCVRLMEDMVDAVRRTAAECLCMGGSSLGSHGDDASLEWIKNIVIPCIRQCASNKISKQRLLSLKMIESVLSDGSWQTKTRAPAVIDESRPTVSPIKELASIALSLTQDRIANVRLNVGRVLMEVLYVFEDEDLSFIKEVLIEQLNSEQERGGDRDVMFFARKCVERADGLLEERHHERSTSLS